MNTDLDNAFEIEVVEPTTIDGELVNVSHETVDIDKNVDADYEKIRINLHNILEKGTEAFNQAIRVALEAEHPTAFEVAGSFMKNLVDANERLLALSEKRLKLKQDTGGSGGVDGDGKTINNAIFVGTSALLQQVLREEQEKEAREKAEQEKGDDE